MKWLLDKLRYYISADILKTIYYALFDSHMRYACQIWGQSHSKTFDMIQSAQNKALRIINFKQSMEPSEPLYQKLKINKLKNNILNNCLFVFDKVTNIFQMYLISSFSPLKSSVTTTPGGHNNIYLIFQNNYADVWFQFNKI